MLYPILLPADPPTFPSLHLRHSSFSNHFIILPTSELILQSFHCFTFCLNFFNSSQNCKICCILFYCQLILQPFRHFIYVTAHSPTILSLYLRHNSFSNPSFACPTSQALHLIQLCFTSSLLHFTYVTTHSPTLPSLYLYHNSFSNPSFACPTSQALHLIHLASRPCR